MPRGRPKKYSDEAVQENLRSFFSDSDHWAYQYGGPSRCGINSPYHRKQIEVLFENKYWHWVTNRNVDFLIDDGFLKERKTEIANFVYRLGIRYIKREINRRKKMIQRYSDPVITKAIGDYAEMLFEFMFRVHGFKIVGRKTNKYKGVKWTKTKHDLDFIIKGDRIAYGIEVKNTLPYMEKDEFEIKIEMCEYLGLVPLWILRKAPGPQFHEIKAKGGFILQFKTQMYPPGQEPLVRDMWNLMRLPVAVWKRIPEKVEKRFLWQHERRNQK